MPCCWPAVNPGFGRVKALLKKSMSCMAALLDLNGLFHLFALEEAHASCRSSFYHGFRPAVLVQHDSACMVFDANSMIGIRST